MNHSSFEDVWQYVSIQMGAVCKQYDQQWIKRHRTIDSMMLVGLVLQAAYAKNEQGYVTVIGQFWERAKSSIPRVSVLPPIAASSFCEARRKLSEQIFVDMSRLVNENLAGMMPHDLKTWRGHRVLAVDASKINVPRSLIKEHFQLPTATSYYPQGLLSCMYDLQLETAIDVSLSNFMSERYSVDGHLEKATRGDIVIFDRGYFSYDALAKHLEKGIHGIWRIKSSGNMNGIQKFIAQKPLDKTVFVQPTDRYKRALKVRFEQTNIDGLEVRVIKFTFKGKKYYFATTLYDSDSYPLKAIADLYQKRWRLEEFFKVIKRVTGLEDFRGKSLSTVLQELHAHVLLLSLTRLFIAHVEPTLPNTEKTFQRGPRYIKKKRDFMLEHPLK